MSNEKNCWFYVTIAKNIPRCNSPHIFILAKFRPLTLKSNRHDLAYLAKVNSVQEALMPNALRFTYQNLKSCKCHKKTKQKHQTLSFQFFIHRSSIFLFFELKTSNLGYWLIIIIFFFLLNCGKFEQDWTKLILVIS